LRVCAMGRFGSACLLLATSAVCAEVPWKAWLQSFGHDSFRYPAWIKEQKEACHCRIHDRLHVQCWGKEDNAVMWQTARELDWCVARQFLLSHMPEFDLHFLPGSVSVDGESMLDDNIAFALMAWNASNLNPRPPMAVALPYLLPYASYHEARSNWRPLFFAKYFSAAAELQSSQAVVDALIGDGVRLMNWTSFKWADFPGKSESNIYELGPFASGSTPPVVAPADFLLYGYGSCTAWAKFLSSALRAVGVPAREVGSPCWNTGIFTGLAESNINVSLCWQGGVSGGPVGGKYLNNHNWVEYWDNAVHTWRFLDVATSSSSETTWFCGKFQDGCSCTSNAGLAMQDHEILAPTWSAVGDDPDVHGGPILDVAKDLVLSSGEAVSPLVWSPRLTSPLGIPMKNVGLRVVNRTTFYRCRKLPNWTVNCSEQSGLWRKQPLTWPGPSSWGLGQSSDV